MSRIASLACIVVLGALTAGNFAKAGDTISVNDANRELLQGEWSGRHSVRDDNGRQRWHSKVTLFVSRPPQVGQFTINKSRDSWRSPIMLENGKVLLRYGFDFRKFTVEKNGDDLEMEARYRSKWAGRNTDNTITLKKR